jgi:hypothetical protein
MIVDTESYFLCLQSAAAPHLIQWDDDVHSTLLGRHWHIQQADFCSEG